MNATYKTLLSSIPSEGYERMSDDETGVILIYKAMNNGKYWINWLDGYSARKIRSSYASTMDIILNHFKKLVEFNKRMQNDRQNRRLLRLKGRDEYAKKLSIGTIMSSSWGYEQTNVNFYQITEIKGLKITYREIGKIEDESKNTGCSMSNYVLPVKDQFISEDITTILKGSGITFNSHRSLTIWDGESEYCSWYY